MAAVSVFNEKNTKAYKHTFKTQMDHLSFLLNEYVVRDEKVKSRCYCGINCDDNPESAFNDFVATKIEFNKYNPNDEKSREFKHYSISFNPDESKKLGAEIINKMCKEIIERVPEFKNFQISIATHEDKDHIHSHIIVNSVNMLDGHKIQLSKDFLTKFQGICNEYTAEYGLKVHTLPNELKLGDQNVSFGRVDYSAHQKGKVSKTEQFARRIEQVIKNTNNRYELFKAMKQNNLTMKWNDDKNYNDKLNIGKITIIDNKTGEKHRLEKLYKRYNIDLMNNIDLVNHFKLLDKINKIKNEAIIKNIKINKNDLIKINNKNELKQLWNEINNLIKNNDKLKYWELNNDIKNKLKEFCQNIYNNTPYLQDEVSKKVEELLIKAKDLNKNLNYSKEEISIKNKLFTIMSNKIFNSIKYNSNNNKNIINLSFLIKELAECVKNCNNNTLNKASSLNNSNNKDLEDEKKRLKDIEKAITY